MGSVLQDMYSACGFEGSFEFLDMVLAYSILFSHQKIVILRGTRCYTGGFNESLGLQDVVLASA